MKNLSFIVVAYSILAFFIGFLWLKDLIYLPKDSNMKRYAKRNILLSWSLAGMGFLIAFFMYYM